MCNVQFGNLQFYLTVWSLSIRAGIGLCRRGDVGVGVDVAACGCAGAGMGVCMTCVGGGEFALLEVKVPVCRLPSCCLYSSAFCRLSLEGTVRTSCCLKGLS